MLSCVRLGKEHIDQKWSLSSPTKSRAIGPEWSSSKVWGKLIRACAPTLGFYVTILYFLKRKHSQTPASCFWSWSDISTFIPRSSSKSLEENPGLKVETSDQKQLAGVCECFLFDVVSQRDAFQIVTFIHKLEVLSPLGPAKKSQL